MRFENINNLYNYIDGYRHSKITCRKCGKPTSLHLWNFSNDNADWGMFVRIVCPHCQWFDNSSHKEWWKDKEKDAPQITKKNQSHPITSK
jgi:hypothetical protein